jgi:SAM-dependent methyltransferase
MGNTKEVSQKVERERILPDDPVYPRLFNEHLARYKLASCYIKEKRVLDSGCGTGYGSYFFARNGALEVYGIDISGEAIDFCTHHYSAPNLFFKKADAAKLDFMDEYFDIICAFEVIEHIEDINRFIIQSKRVLKKGGALIISTPNKNFQSEESKDPSNPYHVREYYFEDFKFLLNAYFEQVEFLGQGSKKRYKIIPRCIQSFPFWIKNSILFKNILIKKAESTAFLIDNNIFMRKKIEENSPFFLGICRKN